MKKRADGRYYRRIRLPDGTEKHLYASNVTALNRTERETANAVDKGLVLDDNTKVGEWAMEWFSTIRPAQRAYTHELPERIQ